MRPRATARLVLSALALALTSCAASHGTCIGACPDAASEDAAVTSVDAPTVDAPLHDAPLGDSGTCLPHAAVTHRAAGAMCDHERPPGSSPDPSAPADCTTDADCTTGTNGRCNGNSHDGWRCTYDSCFSDDDCDATEACACMGSFRSDANACIAGNCRTDADCATGFCSPTLGSCGDYTPPVGYYCHTCEDECVNDADCDTGTDAGFFGRPYCAFDPVGGRWTCESSHCAG